MKIERVTIKNYRSIRELDFKPNEGLNAIIGANSTGKSNIVDAITWLLGPIYPTFNSVTKEDHFMGRDINRIVIKLWFDDNNTLELNEAKEVHTGQGLETRSGLFFNDQNYTCRNTLRERYCSAYLGVDRQILDYLPSNKWSLVGRILQEINKKFHEEEIDVDGVPRPKTEVLKSALSDVRDRLLFSVKDEHGEEIMGKFLSILQSESAAQLNRPESDFKIDFNLYDPWNFYKTLQLLVTEEDMGGLELQASNLGMGVQASITIAILKAYSQLNLSNNTPIFIDEPELFLHPQAQRNFYRILRELSEDKLNDRGEIIRVGTQIFYTTHSSNFLSAGKFNEIFLTRKNHDQGTYLKYAEPQKFVEDLRIRKGIQTDYETLMLHFMNAYENTGDTQKANEGFFSRKIILVEGQSEALILPYFFDKQGYDYIRKGVSVVRCGSKGEIDRFYRLYTELGIPCFAIFDGDDHLIGARDREENVSRNKDILSLFGDGGLDYPDSTVKSNYLGFRNKFDLNLGISPPLSVKGLQLFVKTKELLESGQIRIPEWLNQVITNVEELDENTLISVLRTAPPRTT